MRWHWKSVKALAWAIASASVEEIDQINILHASMLAMARAVDALAVTPSEVQVDGNRTPKLFKPLPVSAIVKARRQKGGGGDFRRVDSGQNCARRRAGGAGCANIRFMVLPATRATPPRASGGELPSTAC